MKKFIIEVPYSEVAFAQVEAEDEDDAFDRFLADEYVSALDDAVVESADTSLPVEFHEEGSVEYERLMKWHPSLGDAK